LTHRESIKSTVPSYTFRPAAVWRDIPQGMKFLYYAPKKDSVKV
jgi:hypothetical protein